MDLTALSLIGPYVASHPTLATMDAGNNPGQVLSGVVQLAFPSLGWALVLPAGANKVDRGTICRLPGIGGMLGGGIYNCPLPGTFVTYRIQKGTDVGYIVQCNNQGTEGALPAPVIRLRQHQKVPCISDMAHVQKLVQYVQEIDRKQKAAATGALQDQYAGDVVVGDRHGPQAFFGRAQMELKGSDLSYMQFSATEDKITTVTTEAQLDTFSDKNTISVALNKTLKASGALQGLGGRAWETDPLMIQDEQLLVKYKQNIKDPIFRFQQFNGGKVQGYHTSIVCPLKEKEDKQPVAMAQLNSYRGQHLRMSVGGNTFIKSPFTAGLVEKTYKESQETQAGKLERAQFGGQIAQLAQKYSKVQLSENGLQRALQLDAIIKEDTRQLLYDMLGTAVTEMLGEDVQALPDPFGLDLSWEGDQPSVAGQTFGDYPTTSIEDSLTKKTIKQFKNTSFITQDPDGTITIKDGWGSQITMSHGNIYISSALDTFIRPGRKLVAMVPSDICISNNGEVQVAAKQDIKIGTQKSLVMASAIGGEEGYTVLENRTKKKGLNTGMVIRSNGYLTLTSSDDMHIGINDKREVNSRDAVNYGKGSIFLEGEKIRVESRDQLRLTGTKVGVYAYQDKQGCGLQISTGDLTMVAPIINLDTGALQVGKFATTYTIQTGAAGDNTVTLKKGGDTLIAHIRGALQCRDITSGGTLYASGSCVAADYMVLQTSPQEEIPGTKQSIIKKFRAQISKMFKTPLKSAAQTYASNLQAWYKDSFICGKELSFTDSWSATGDIPAMCWQMQQATQNYDPFYKISVKSTGGDAQTCSYPGKTGWEQNHIITVDNEYNIKEDQKLDGSYRTYTKKGK